MAVWFLLVVVEFMHGTLRALFLAPQVGDWRSRQIGVFTGSLLIVIVACLTIRFIRPPNLKSLIFVGLLWLVLMVAFELGLGRLLGRSWAGLLSDYNIAQGGLLPFGMVVLALSPLIAVRLCRCRLEPH
jgi:hypothetical protein